MLNFKNADGEVVMTEKDNGEVEFKLAEDKLTDAKSKAAKINSTPVTDKTKLDGLPNGKWIGHA
jgi:hypothetical protein